MRILNVAKIGVLLLCILLTLPTLTGCANGTSEQDETEADEQELLVQVENKWNAVMTLKESLVAKAEMSLYIPQPPTTTMQPSQGKRCDDVEQINMIIDLFKDKELEFQHLPSDQESFDAHVSSLYGKETYAIAFYDSQDQKILRIEVNEDNVAVIYEPYWIDEHEAWHSTCIVCFSEPIFSTLKQLFENIV